MQHTLRILLVDDEETFLHSSAQLLRRAGYECDCAAGVDEAGSRLETGEYDLVIADINMPGNADLEFARTLAARDDGLPIILVTAYPSIASAIESVELPVVAYLVKPFDFEELLAKVQIAARRVAALMAVRDELDRLQDYRRGLLRTESHMRHAPYSGGTPAVQAFVGRAMRNIVDSLVGLHKLMENGPPADVDVELQSWPAPKGADLRKVLRDTVATLERTKSAFKSKELGELRRKLECLLEE